MVVARDEPAATPTPAAKELTMKTTTLAKNLKPGDLILHGNTWATILEIDAWKDHTGIALLELRLKAQPEGYIYRANTRPSKAWTTSA